MTTSKELFQAAIRKEEVDRVPVGPPFQGYWALGLAGIKVKESIENPERSARAQLSVMDSCGFDSIETMWDWLSPVEALGCEVKVPDFGTIPTWTNIVKDHAALDKLEVPDPRKDYRFEASMKTTDLLAKEVGREKYLMLTTVAPFTLAGELRGVETMMLDSLMEPDFVRDIVNVAMETVATYLEEMTKADVDAVIMADPTASGSLISKDDFARFSQSYMKECGKIVKGPSKQFIIHICGDTSDRLDLVADVGADVFSIDYQVDIADAMRLVGGRQTILGNVKPAHTLFSGTPEDVWKESLACIKKGGKRGYILGAGCDIAPGTPLENVQVWKEVVKIPT
jgi:MtaA/CmuA family methyltransferase